MRFHVRYASGTEHDVDLTGTIATLGRDPSCDLVLNDPKCSRRHAVLEGEPGALSIRDSGSANGVFVNGKRVDRTPLGGGDVIQIGEVFLTVLEAPTERTVVMEPDDLELSPTSSHPPGALDPELVTRPSDAVRHEPQPRPIVPRLPTSADLAGTPLPLPPPRPALAIPPARPAAAPPEVRNEPPRPRPVPPRPPAAPPAPVAAARPAMSRAEMPVRPAIPAPLGPAGAAPQAVLAPLTSSTPLDRRPMAVTALAGAAFLNALVALAVAFALALLTPRSFPVPPVLAALGAALVSIVSGVLGVGFAARAPWARATGIVAAGAGVPTCALTPIAVATLAYLLREETRVHFLPVAERRRVAAELATRASDDGMDLAFAGAIAGAAALGLMVTVVGLFFTFGLGSARP